MPKKSKSNVDSRLEGSTVPSQSRSSEEEDFNRHYDLTPLGSKRPKRKDGERSKQAENTTSTLFIDPWEISSPTGNEGVQPNDLGTNQVFFASSNSNDSDSLDGYDERFPSEENVNDDEDHRFEGTNTPLRSSFIGPSDIHPRMEEREDDIAQLRLLAGTLNADWGAGDFMAPALARRIRDFQFAQEKRRKKYGHEKPWGILGLYDHLASIRVDVEWAEDAAWRRANGQP
ncbi:unnamed protein product [Pseudo-nitzschia multistriata]|nr:unnamed protein product [Pseudo-nitzschia multistriata]